MQAPTHRLHAYRICWNSLNDASVHFSHRIKFMFLLAVRAHFVSEINLDRVLMTMSKRWRWKSITLRKYFGFSVKRDLFICNTHEYIGNMISAGEYMRCIYDAPFYLAFFVAVAMLRVFVYFDMRWRNATLPITTQRVAYFYISFSNLIHDVNHAIKVLS